MKKYFFLLVILITKKNRKSKNASFVLTERCYYTIILIGVNMYTRGLSIINSRFELHDIDIYAKMYIRNQIFCFLPDQIIKYVDKER